MSDKKSDRGYLITYRTQMTETVSYRVDVPSVAEWI